MRIALDTNRYVDFRRGHRDVVAALESADEVILPFITVGELRAGFLRGTRRAENEQGLVALLSRPGVSVLYPDDQTTRLYAELWLQLKQQGTPIPTNDIWTAALVLQHHLHLYARDHHFDHLPQLQRL